MLLPTTVKELLTWYTFRDFLHFVALYVAASRCLQTPNDVEEAARAFLAQQAAQHIRYSEVTWTALTHVRQKGLAFRDQLAALNRARRWAEDTLRDRR
ncbi:MAG: hypothetical protein H7Y32_04595 [Chloroflexales bacterium]|nr:hypothetical protein [Chloroflexales bacterium]